MTKMTGSQFISETFKGYGIEHLFVMPYVVDPKIVIKIYNFSTLHKNMHVLKYSILNSFAQNPAISTFFRKVHSDEREFAG